MFRITDNAKKIILDTLKENNLDTLKVLIQKHGDHSHIGFDLIKKEEASNLFVVNDINVDCDDENLKEISHLILDADDEGLILHSTQHCCGHDHEDHDGCCCEGDNDDCGCGCGCEHHEED